MANLPHRRKPPRRDPVRLVCFDLDGVLIDQESSWVAVHEHFGLNNEASLRAFLRGRISDAEFIRRDVALWRRARPEVRLRDVERILRRRLTLAPGARTAVRALRRAGVDCAIVSGGLEPAATLAASALGIRRISVNRLDVDPQGRLTGRATIRTPLRDKGVPVRRFARELGIPAGHIASVGNSSPDIGMFRASGLGIAFRPSDSFVRRAADLVVEGPDLRDLLEPILSPNGGR